jgi:aspartate kinase
MKFGGATVKDAPSVRNVVNIVRSRLPLRPVLVVSAMGKTTRRLLDAVESSVSGDLGGASQLLGEIRTEHEKTARDLMGNWAESPESRRTASYFEELERLFGGIAVLGELSPQSQDKVLSYGELLSSALLCGSLVRSGLDTEWLDSRKLVLTDDRFTRAKPLEEESAERLRDAVLPIVGRGCVPVLQGYIGSTRHGLTTTLGFEGSDYTAALCGAAIGASEIQIWKDVPGMMTADPELIPDALTVKSVSYREAAELTFWGARILHPRAVEPAVRKGIPIRIAHTGRPEEDGTLVSETESSGRNRIKSISYKKPVTWVRLRAEESPGWNLLPSVIREAEKADIDLGLAAAGGHDVSVTFSPGPRSESFLDALARLGRTDVRTERATVSLVGAGLDIHRGRLSEWIGETSDPAEEALFCGVSPVCCILIVRQENAEDAVRRLHGRFFRDPDPTLFERIPPGGGA